MMEPEVSPSTTAKPSKNISPKIMLAIENFVTDYKDGQGKGEIRVGDYVSYGARGVLYGPTHDLAAVLGQLKKDKNGFRVSGNDYVVLRIPESLPEDIYDLADTCIAKSQKWGQHLEDNDM